MSEAEPINGPYRGLIPYSEEDAWLFFGRNRERENIISNLMGSRLTILYGPTGVGKSSVLNAGVAFQLYSLAAKKSERKLKPEFAPVVFRDWHDDPLLNIQKAIKTSVARALGSDADVKNLPTDNLLSTLEKCSELVGGDLLIILDQFEEYFLYRGRGESYSEFAEQFARAVNRVGLRASFLISIREDAVAKLDFFKGKIPELFNNYLRIQYLTSASARNAIIKPLEVYSQFIGAQPEFTIEDELVREVCKQVRTDSVHIGETGYGSAESNGDTDQVETSFLQLVMTKLWEAEPDRHRLHLKTLKKLGGASTIVEMHVDENLKVFPDDEQAAAAAIFRYLVTPSGTKVAYGASDLAQLTKLPLTLTESLLDKLCAGDKRILRAFYTVRRNQTEKSYEIFHDMLARAILDWSVRYLQNKERMEAAQEAKEKEERERALMRARLEAEAQQRLRQEEERRRKEQVRAQRRTKQLLTILMLSAVATTVMVVLYFNGEEQRKEAERQRAEAERQRAEAQKMLSIVQAQDRSVPFFKAVMRGHTAPVVALDVSPDGQRMVTASVDSTARVWDAASGRLLFELKSQSGTVRDAAFSPDGRLIATAGDDSVARVWDAATGNLTHELRGHAGTIRAVRFSLSTEGSRMVTAGADGTARVWDAATGERVSELGHPGGVNYAAFSRDGSSVVTAGVDGTARVWHVSGSDSVILSSHQKAVNTAEFSPDGSLVVTASADWEARLWRLGEAGGDGGSIVLKGHQGPVNAAEFSPDGALVVTASDDRTARVWEVGTRRPLTELKGHQGEVLTASFDPDGARVITTSADNTARVWEAVSGRQLAEMRGHSGRVNDAAFAAGGRLAATVSDDNTARTWDVSGATGLRVTAVEVNALENFRGYCPASVKVDASITAVGSGTVKFKFVRNDGKAGQERSIEFEASGKKEVNSPWRTGGRDRFSEGFRLEITSPQVFISKEVRHDVTCLRPSNSGSADPAPDPASTPVSVPTPP